jgi:hypothetical protein
MRKNTFIDGDSVEELEQQIRDLNSKTLDVDSYKVYLYYKNNLNQMLQGFYQQEIFREMRMASYSGGQKSDAKFLKEFEKTFGPPSETAVFVGDWSSNGGIFGTVRGIGVRNVLRAGGYRVSLVKEAGTSQKCCKCGNWDKKGVCSMIGSDVGRCKRFRYYKIKKPGEEEKTCLRWGLVMCQACSTPFNRDVNAASNMWRIVYGHIRGEGRPLYLMFREQREREIDRRNLLPPTPSLLQLRYI